jgi:iron complex outermembrane receptor protein
MSRLRYISSFALPAVFIFISHRSFAQKVDTLKEVKVHGWRKRNANNEKINTFAPGQKLVSIDTLTLQQYHLQNIANMLAQQTPVFVKSYGFNSIATLNFRGSSAAQSQVLWNGVPIQNASSGIADVSTLPVMLMNKVNIVYGSAAALLGSGNVGGALLLENDAPVFDSNRKSTLSVSAGAGSFAQYMGGLNAAYSTRKWYFALNGLVQTAQNNFSYINDTGKTEKLTNSRLRSGAVMAEADYKIADNNIVGIKAWYQHYLREVPPALFETGSDKRQTDASLRLLGDWNKQTVTTHWYAKTSFIKDEVDYTDPSIPYTTRNPAYQLFGEVDWDYALSSRSNLLLFIPLQYSWMSIDTGGQKAQSRIALAGAYKISMFQDKLNAALNARDEQINSTNVFLPGISASYMLTHWLQLRANAQRTYRMPSLNELYFNPGGNPDLKPEQGWGEDAGYELKTKLTNNLSLYSDGSVFNRQIHDWIIWLGGVIWTPHNIAIVHSRGVETENRLEWGLGNWKLHLGVNTAYTIATTVSSYIPNDGSVGKQIPYTPRYNGQANIGFTYKRLYFNYNHTYTGYRFITTDESEYTLPYQTGNVSALYNCTLGSHRLQLSAQVNNIWNEHYQVVAFRPMPGINWLLGIKYNIF